MTREKMARLVHLPPRANELVLVSDLKRQVTFMVGALTRTLTVPLPLQFPERDFKKGASSAWATLPDKRTSSVIAVAKDWVRCRCMEILFRTASDARSACAGHRGRYERKPSHHVFVPCGRLQLRISTGAGLHFLGHRTRSTRRLAPSHRPCSVERNLCRWLPLEVPSSCLRSSKPRHDPRSQRHVWWGWTFQS